MMRALQQQPVLSWNKTLKFCPLSCLGFPVLPHIRPFFLTAEATQRRRAHIRPSRAAAQTVLTSGQSLGQLFQLPPAILHPPTAAACAESCRLLMQPGHLS